MRVGVLAFQGDVREHVRMLDGLDVEAALVRTPAQLDAVDGLIIPGGESSVIDKLARQFGVRDRIRERIADGMPVFGTCAGLILLADEVLDAAPGQESFGGLDIAVRRNAFGAQTESFETDVTVDGLDAPPIRASFIRAPVVERVGPDVQVLTRVGDRVVAVQQDHLLGVAFHPEVNGDDRLHARFVAGLG